MPLSRRAFARCGLPLALGVTPALFAQQERYPSRTIRIVVPYAAGGGTDVLGRLLASRLTESLGQSAIVENRPGANSIIGATHVAKAPADGYTVLVGALGTAAVNPAVYVDLPYDIQKEFVPISLMATSPMTLIVPAALPVRTVKELLAHVRANPAAANYAASGTPFHLMGELFVQRTQTRLTNIPFKGTGESVNAVLAGQVTMAFVDTAPVVQLANAGRIRVLAVTSAKRHPSFPDVPTLIEEGIVDREIQLWSALFAPAGTSPAIVDVLAQQIERMARQPETREVLARVGVEPAATTPAALRQLVEADIRLWTQVANTANIKLSRQ